MRSLSFVLALSGLLLTGNFSLATIEDIVQLTGKVVSFNDVSISIESGNQRVEVLRKLYPAKVKTGENISVPMTLPELDSLKKENLKKK